MILIEYKSGNNKSFFIPEFLNDYKKPEEEENQEPYENGLTDAEKAVAWNEQQHQQQLNEFEIWK